jgi:hypothetical protein
MQTFKQLTIFALFAIAGLCTQPPNLASAKHLAKPEDTAREIIQRLNTNDSHRPSAKASLDAAVILQSLPFHQTVKVLDQLASAASYSGRLSGLPRLNDNHVFVLARMLFKAKLGGEFRKPALGGYSPLVISPPSGWPLSPIVIVEGVPFMLPAVRTGRSESPREYLHYCFAWNDFRYTKESKRTPTSSG